MKVLFVQIIRNLAGSEKYIIEAMPLLKKKGIDCEFLCVALTEDGDNYKKVTNQLEAEGIKVHYVFSKNTLNYTLLKNIYTIVYNGKYDLVNSHLIHADVWLALVKFLFNWQMKLVSSKHGYGDAFTTKFGHDTTKRLYNAYYFAALFAEKAVTRSLMISKGLQNLYTTLKICKKENTEVIPYGFTTNYNPPENNEAYRSSANQICIVARLIELKGHKYVLQALTKVVKHIPDVQLILVGDGTEKENLQHLVEELDLSNHVQFMGFRKDAVAFIANSDVKILPSKSEGLGIVFLEAYRVKTPVIAFDVPACNEVIIQNETGFLVKPFDINELADKIIELLQSKKLQAKFTENAYERLTTYYNPERMITETIQFYNNALL